MKKLILSLLIVSAFTFVIYAQEKQDDGSYKPTSGFTAEVNFLPANTSMPISMDMLKLRMFLGENMAIRLGFDFAMHNEKSDVLPQPGTTDPTQTTKNSYMIFGLAPGIEMHMGDLPKLSPYVGAELGFFLKSSGTTVTNAGNQNNSSVETKGAWLSSDSTFSEQGYTEIGLNLILGADYYFSKHVFCGVEIGFGLANTTNSEVKVTYTSAGLSSTSTTPKSTSMNVGFNFRPAFRLGWAF